MNPIFDASLNAPFGARCFLTLRRVIVDNRYVACLNAPFGARCFLTTVGEVTTLASFNQS